MKTKSIWRKEEKKREYAKKKSKASLVAQW